MDGAYRLRVELFLWLVLHQLFVYIPSILSSFMFKSNKNIVRVQWVFPLNRSNILRTIRIHVLRACICIRLLQVNVDDAWVTLAFFLEAQLMWSVVIKLQYCFPFSTSAICQFSQDKVFGSSWTCLSIRSKSQLFIKCRLSRLISQEENLFSCIHVI